MRSILITFIFLALGVSLFAQAPDTLWSRLYGDKAGWDGYDQLYGATPTYDGGFAMNGYSTSFGDTIKGDQWVVKINSSGDTLWTNTFGAFDRRDYGKDIIKSYDKGLVICGHGRIATTSEQYRVRLFKADSLGNQIWEKDYVGSNGLSTEDIIETSDSGFAVVGWTDDKDVFLFRADSLGDSVWLKTYGGTGDDIGYGVCETGDGGFIIAGATDSYGLGSFDIYVIRTDANGDTLWTDTFGGTSFDEGRAVVKTGDGNYLVAGYAVNTNSDVNLIKIDDSGNVLWTKVPYQADWGDMAFGVTKASDSGFLVAGRNWNSTESRYNMYLMKTDANGDSVWTYTCLDNTVCEARVACEGADGTTFLFGTRGTNTSASYRDYWVFAFAGTLDAEDDFTGIFPENVKLSYNYPNPFNPSTTIEYSVPRKLHVRIKVFNILGQEVVTLVDEKKAAGEYEIIWNGKDSDGMDAATGVYFYRLEAGDTYELKKMVLLK